MSLNARIDGVKLSDESKLALATEAAQDIAKTLGDSYVARVGYVDGWGAAAIGTTGVKKGFFRNREIFIPKIAIMPRLSRVDLCRDLDVPQYRQIQPTLDKLAELYASDKKFEATIVEGIDFEKNESSYEFWINIIFYFIYCLKRFRQI